MKRLHRVRHVAIAAMLLVTAWSFWAWAQPRPRPQLEPPTPAQVQTANAEEAHHQAEAEESEQPKPINWFNFGGEYPPYIAMFINFAIMATGYYLFGRKPIAAGLQARRDSIAKEIEEAQRMKKEAEERAKVYQVKLAKLDVELQGAREALVRAGEAERDRIVREAEAKSERMRRDAEFLVEQEMKQIRADLWRDTVEVAVSAAEELLKKRVTAADQERLAEDYLADLGGDKKRIPASGHGPANGTGGSEPANTTGNGAGTQEAAS